MRLHIHLEALHPFTIPTDHLHLTRGAAYHLLALGDTELARRLHDEGIGGDKRGVKLFTYSGLRVPSQRRQINGATLKIAPGPVEWWLSSPQDDFVLNEVRGLLTVGNRLRFGSTELALRGVETHPVPAFGDVARFSCLTPLVASVPSPDGRATAYYLRPSDGEAFSAAVRNNLIRKHTLLHDAPPDDDRFSLIFDPAYLRRAANGGTKKHTVHGNDIIGAFAPFTVTGSPTLISLGWSAGFGEKTGCGFGLADSNGHRHASR